MEGSGRLERFNILKFLEWDKESYCFGLIFPILHNTGHVCSTIYSLLGFATVCGLFSVLSTMHTPWLDVV